MNNVPPAVQPSEPNESKQVSGGSPARPSNAQEPVMGFVDVPAPLQRPMRWFEGIRKKFYYAVAFAIVGVIGGHMLGDLYDRIKPWKTSDDEFVQKLRDSQKLEFDALRVSLGDIQSSLPSEGRKAFNNIERSLANVERDSAGLVAQLDLAKQEVEALKKIAVPRGGLGNGYDFTLAEHSSMDLAPGALIGMDTASSGSVRVNLVSAGVNVASNEYLSAGQSLKYVGADGHQCWVAVRSIQGGSPGVASFNTGCSS